MGKPIVCLFTVFVVIFTYFLQPGTLTIIESKKEVSNIPKQYPREKIIPLNREQNFLLDMGRKLCATDNEKCDAFLRNKTLLEIALIAQTDEFWKIGDNRYYYDAYNRFISHSMRNEKFTIIEFGIYTGQSLWLWRHFFPNARIVGIDLAHQPGYLFFLSLCNIWREKKSYRVG